MLNNYNIQTGYLLDENGKKFDISVILNFPTETDYKKSTSFDDFPSVNLIDFYFGEPNDHDTETYLKQFIEKQNKLRKLAEKLLVLIAANPDDTDLREQYDFVNSQIVELH
jgi:hypothetical protein